MQKQNLLENVEGHLQYFMDKGCSQYSMCMTHTVYKVKLFILAQKFLMDSYPWDEPRFLTQVVLFLFGFILYAMIAS